MNLKKLIASSIMVAGLVGGQAYAAGSNPAGPDPAGADFGVAAAQAGTPAFVQQALNYKLSSNVGASLAQNAIEASVATAHLKGQYSFAGSTNGGSVKACEATAADTGFTTAPSTDVADPCGGRS